MSVHVPAGTAVGDRLATLTVRPNNVDAFLVGVAYWTTHRIHYDREWAVMEGYDDVVVTGVLFYAWIERLAVQWAGSPDAIRGYSFRHTGLATVLDELTFAIDVTSVERNGPETSVEANIDVRKTDGTGVLAGTVRFGFEP